MKRVTVVVLVLLGIATANALGAGPEVPSTAPVEGTVTIAPVSDPDPDGGPPWALRHWRTKDGSTCIQTGRLKDGTLGTVDDKGVFTESKVQAEGCGGGSNIDDSRTVGWGWRSATTNVGPKGCAFAGADRGRGGSDLPICTDKQLRTVIYGGFGPDLKRVEVANADWSGRRDVQVAGGIFVSVYRGLYNDLTQPRIRLYFDGGCGPKADELVQQWYGATVVDCQVVVPLDEPRPKPESAASKRARKHPSAPRPVRINHKVAGPGRRIIVRFKTPITVEPGDGYGYRVDGPPACKKLLGRDGGISSSYVTMIRDHWAELWLPLGGKSKPWCRGRYTASVFFWHNGKEYDPFGSVRFRIK